MATGSSAQFPYPNVVLPSSTTTGLRATTFLNLSRISQGNYIEWREIGSHCICSGRQSNRPSSTSTLDLPAGSRELLLGDATSNVEEPAEGRRSGVSRAFGRALNFVKRIGRRDANPHTLLENEESMSTTQESPNDVGKDFKPEMCGIRI